MFVLVFAQNMFKLASLDPEIGSVNVIGNIRTGQKAFLTGLVGLAMDETHSKMYTYSQTDTKLWELKLRERKAGKAIPVFETGISGIIDMASHPQNGLIYATTGTALYKINQNHQRVKLLNDGVKLSGIWFSRDGVLHGIMERASNK